MDSKTDDLAGADAHPPLELHEMPGHLIRRMQQIAVSIWLDETGGDLRPVQYASMSAIRALPGMDQMELSRVIAFDRSTIQDVLIRLEKRGLIERRKDAGDGRRRRLYLTAAGEAALDGVAEANARAQSRILDPLDAAERRAFMTMLTRLVAVNNRYSRAPLSGVIVRDEEEQEQQRDLVGEAPG